MAVAVGTTALDIIKLALAPPGIVALGQTPKAEDTNRSLMLLNMMLGQWQRKRWLVYHLVDQALQMTGAQSYTIGLGGQFNIARPDRVEAAFIRMLVPTGPNQIDYPLRLLESREDYNRLALKTLNSFPQYLFYDSAFPLGNLFPWPLPSSQYELHVSLKEQLGTFALASTALNLPPEYFEALWTNLSVRLFAIYQRDIDPVILGLAKASLNTIRGANTQIPVLVMPRALAPGGGYNIYSDSSGPAS